MFDPKSLDDIARRLADSVPAPLRQLQQDLEKNFTVILQSALSRLNLVTREEFDVQAAVLARSRARVETLEKRLAELEARMAPPAAAEEGSSPTPRRRSPSKKPKNDS